MTTLDKLLQRFREVGPGLGLGKIEDDGAAALAYLRLRERVEDGDAAARDLLERLTPGGGTIRRPSREFPRGTLRVGFVTPTMESPGGAEDWIRSLVAERVDGVEWSGVATVAEAPSPTWVHPACWMGTGEGAIRELEARSDALLIWGIERPRETILSGTTAPLISVSHGSGEWTQRILAGAHDWAAARVAVSEAAAQGYERPGGVTVLHNGIDLARVVPTVDRDELRRSWGVDPGDVVVAFFGRHSWEKNPVAHCYGTAALGAGYVPALIGDGWQQAGVRQRARQIDQRVILADPALPGAVFPGIDVFALLSPSEGFSLAMLEAWAFGLPVVATAVGAVPELEREHGQLVHRVEVFGSPEQVAEAIEAACSPEAASVTLRAREVVRRHFTRRAMAERYGAFLRGLAR